MDSTRAEIQLLRLTPDDWPVWRDLRLAALAEAPYAFGSTLADWQGPAGTEARWRARLTDVPFNLAAEWREMPAGMVSGTTPDPEGWVELISMWVAPFARGRGVGDALVRAVVEWASEQAAAAIVLAVFEGNERAMALYRRNGFTDANPGLTAGSNFSGRRKMVRKLR